VKRPVRVIPTLLLHRGGLYKTVEFSKPQYVGDPVNAVRVFNDKEADELLVLDIDASRERRTPQLRLLEELASEAFMPVTYGGGVRTIADFDAVFATGVEKVAVNSSVLADPTLLAAAADRFGKQSVAAVIDVKKERGGWQLLADGGRTRLKADPVETARRYERAGAGELVVQSVDRDGHGVGYDLALISAVTAEVGIPVIALGGAADVEHLRAGLTAGAAGVAAGSMFVFRGKRRAVLLSYLSEAERASLT